MNTKWVFCLLLTLIASSCGKNDKFIYYQPQSQKNITEDSKITDLLGSSAVDLIWVVDNSGSMEPAQNNISQNSALFLDNFIKTGIDWKLGLISTDARNRPFLGFDSNAPFDSKSQNPVGTFQNAIDSLGTNGSPTEETFEPILKHLDRYPDFLRKNTPLVFIIVTDALEQSDIKEKDFMIELRKIIGNDRKLYVYTVLDAKDNGCSGTQDSSYNPLIYKGSPYEAFTLDSDGGKNYPMCSPKFGELLAELGNDIKNKVQNLNLYLKERPKTSTLKITYHGEVLPGGPQSSGGYWYYDYSLNAITFYNVNFAKGEIESVSVSYDKDDGIKE